MQQKLQGRAQTATGIDIPHAYITLFSAEADQQLATAFTDTTGRFELEPVPDGVYELRIEAPGFARLEVRGLRIGQGETMILPGSILELGSVACSNPDPKPQFLQLVQSSGGSSGALASTAVNHEGKALANVRVSVKDGAGTRFVTAATNGKFEINGLAPGLYTVHLHRSGYFDEDVQNVRVQGGFLAVYRGFGLDRCPLGWCNPKFRRRKVALCE